MGNNEKEKLNILLTIIQFGTIGSTLRTYCEDELITLLKESDKIDITLFDDIKSDN